MWLIDPGLRMTLEVLQLDGATYRISTTVRGDARVRAEPFDALELELGLLWAMWAGVEHGEGRVLDGLRLVVTECPSPHHDGHCGPEPGASFHGPDGLVRIALKKPFSDGSVAVDLDPLSLLCRLHPGGSRCSVSP